MSNLKPQIRETDIWIWIQVTSSTLLLPCCSLNN